MHESTLDVKIELLNGVLRAGECLAFLGAQFRDKTLPHAAAIPEEAMAERFIGHKEFDHHLSWPCHDLSFSSVWL